MTSNIDSINYGLANKYKILYQRDQLIILYIRHSMTLFQTPIKQKTTHYYTGFYLFNTYESSLLCHYKYFIEKTIIKLGQDWRVQSNLLAQQILSQRSTQDTSKDQADFNLFNEFLSAFLWDKIGKEYSFTNHSESQIQKQFVEIVNDRFPQENIHNGLTFKTLTLGFCITATEIWNRAFKNPIDKSIKSYLTLKPFATLYEVVQGKQLKYENKSNLEISSIRRKIGTTDILRENQSKNKFKIEGKNSSSEQQSNVGWQNLDSDILSEKQMKQIKATLQKIPHNLKKTQVLSYFVAYIDELHLKSGKCIRVFSIANQFYLNAFIIWLIFNIKMFFSLTFSNYLRYFKQLCNQSWKQSYEKPLKKFQIILQREWQKLLKDFTVALHDDQEVLNILVEKVKKCLRNQWQCKVSSLKQSFRKQK